MAKRKTHLTIKASRSRKKDLRLGRRKEAPLIPCSCVKWPRLLDVIPSPQKFRPTPSKSPATKRLRGGSARSLFSTETCDDTFEAFPLVFTDQQLGIVGECNVSSSSHNNYDLQAPQMSDTLQSISISQTPLEEEIQKMNAFSPMYSKPLKNPEQRNPEKCILCPLMKFMNFPPKILHPRFQDFFV